MSSSYLHLHQNLDKWAWDIEQELKTDPEADRKKLIDKHSRLTRLRDEKYTKYMGNATGAYKAPLYCYERYQELEETHGE